MRKSLFTARQRRLQTLLIEARKAQGMTQVELARRLKRRQSFISDYERGQRRLDVIEFLDITRALKADPHAIIDRLRR